MKRWDVLGFGAVAVDDLLYLPRHPQPDEKIEILGKARDGGGLAGTALVAAARMGASAAWAGVLGYDELSLWTLDAFAQAHVDTTPVVRRDGARPIHSIVMVDRSTDTRAILYTFDGVRLLTQSDISSGLIASARVVFLDHTLWELAGHVLLLARQAGVPTVADVERSGPGVAECLAAVDHLIVGQRFAAEATGEQSPARAVAALAALRPGRSLTAVTAGANGCWHVSAECDEVAHEPALAVQAADTTGCGDVFHGAYAAGIAQGASIAESLRLATVAAGLKATRAGGRQGIPSRVEVNDYP